MNCLTDALRFLSFWNVACLVSYMTKKILILSTLFFGLIAMFTIYQIGQFAPAQGVAIVNKMAPSVSRPPVRQTTNTQEAQTAVVTPNAAESSTVLTATDEQVQAIRNRLELQKERIAALKYQQMLSVQQLNVAYPNQINTYSSQIINLTDYIQQQRLIENELDQAANLALQDQNNFERMNREQLDLNIQQIEQNLQQIRETLSQPAPREVITLTEQQDRITNLQNLYAEQNQQVLNLKGQRTNLTVQTLNQGALISSALQTQRSELAENQSALQDEIFSLRNEIVRLQNFSNQTRSNIDPLNQQISQAESDYQNQLQQMQTLQNTEPAQLQRGPKTVQPTTEVR